MATNTAGKSATIDTSDLTAGDIARAIVTPLASLRLTVFLLILGVVVTFIATLDQTRADVFQVKMKHFEQLLVEVPFQTFFVPRWFPDHQNIPGSIYIPSGMTVLVMMLINLTAAHVLRFRLQAKGKSLILGTLAAIFAAFLTWAVIFNGQNSNGFQAEPPLSWKQMWVLLQVGLGALAIASTWGWFALGRDRKVERLLLALAAITFVLGLGLTLFLPESGFIGDSAMRILWQLIQSTMAALVSYFACLVLFRRKAGIVLLHLGVAGLMLNEIYVTTTNDEQRMTIFEGQTVSLAVDIRATEIAIIDTSDPEIDEIVSIPGNRLQPGETISDSELPFDIRCVSYFPNSDLRRVTGTGTGQTADTGIGLQLEAFEIAPSAGTDSEQTVDLASAYVELLDKSNGDSLGTHLITQNIEEHNSDEVAIDGTSYRIALRFKTAYKPYSLTLKDAQREDYIGTDTPRFYGSKVELNDFENGIKSEQLIWMNNPLRYSDETFYQSGMNTLPDGRELSIIQVVRNKGWMIPYVCCMFTVVGLMAQFGSSLLGFLEKNREKEQRKLRKRNELEVPSSTSGADSKHPDKTPIVDDSLAAAKGTAWEWIPTAVLVGIMAIWVVGEIYKDSKGQVVGEMRLDLLGKLPVTINGRVQPLDSYARNTARQLSKRETVFDGNDEKQSAIRWLADNMFEADGFEDYRIFRIEDMNILGALELPPAFAGDRGNFRYTLAEILEAEPTLRELIPTSDQTDPNNWTVFQKRLNLVAGKLQRLYGLKLAFGGPDRPEQDLLSRLEESSRAISSPLIPLVIPTDDPENPWVSFTSIKNRAWLNEVATQFECDSTASLARAIIEQEIIPPLREDTIRARIIQRFLSDPEFLKVIEQQHDEKDPRILAQLMEQNWDQFPEKIKSELVTSEGPLVDALIAQQMPRFEAMMEKQLIAVNGSAGEIQPGSNEFADLLFELQPAYKSGDAEKFNSTLESYLAKVGSNPPKGMSNRKLNLEGVYNSVSPFYLASVLYLVALLISTFGWIGWRRPWNRAATTLLCLGLAIQVFGIVARVIISGRPPVTNLYSSVLFVSAVTVVLMLIVERITKLGVGNILAALGAFLALMWAWTMTIVDGDTFTVMVAVLDTQFWLSTHVVCISIGYAATFVAGLLGLAYIIGLLLTPAFATKEKRRVFSNVIYGTVCFGLLCSFFGTVLGGLWGDDSWGRFWGWDPKENGALMIVLWNAVVLHARWGGMVRDRGLAALCILGNVIVLWSWKGVNAMGVGLHAYAATEDDTVSKILMIGAAHIFVAGLVVIPMKFWMSYSKDQANQQLQG